VALRDRASSGESNQNPGRRSEAFTALLLVLNYFKPWSRTEKNPLISGHNTCKSAMAMATATVAIPVASHLEA